MPGGLKNLGATCYLNSLLQVRIPYFKNACYYYVPLRTSQLIMIFYVRFGFITKVSKNWFCVSQTVFNRAKEVRLVTTLSSYLLVVQIYGTFLEILSKPFYELLKFVKRPALQDLIQPKGPVENLRGVFALLQFSQRR